MPNFKHLPIGKKAPNVVNAMIEIPRGSRNKIEYDPELEVFRLDRVLFSSMHYPVAYGFIPSTLGGDGDPIDILIFCDQPLPTGLLIEAIPIGALDVHDDKGEDLKIIAVAAGDESVNRITDISQLQEYRKTEIEYFFATYKELEGKTVKLGGWLDADEAKALITKAEKNFDKHNVL